MTLANAYEAILGVAGRPESAARVAAMRRTFEERTGHFGPADESASQQRIAHVDDAWIEARSRAFWDDALTRQRFARDVAGELAPDARGWVPGLTTAHRGLFRAERVHGKLVLVDLWGGADFAVDEIDDSSRDAIDVASAPFDARVAARWEGEDGTSAATPQGGQHLREDAYPVVALLPGSIFHPAEAEEALLHVLEVARARALGTDDVLDALLRMELSLKTLSRVKPAYAYRPEALVLR